MADTPETPKAPVPRAATRRHAPRKTSAAKPAAKAAPKAKRSAANGAKPAAKPRASARPAKGEAKTATTGKVATGKVATVKARVTKAAGKASEKVGGKWGSAAIAGGLAVVGAAATAALLSLRGSTPRKDEAEGGAHSPDGEDASASFRAGIADENSIPDKV
ncbi:hypothetical protein F9288_15740 [Sphingomonas sp. CL5.1]|uniref:hypothetical protein n=1 Tax=Sphingomonas sp. CL5.1 TaxID=2653203 RepID=UPI00158217FF|nr:hypothetical protein [Sphingomonas sp. CL5.1]QKS00915.1 hypothetical protein F9288_15740 [Sphingomonas sp. CL5.1]